MNNLSPSGAARRVACPGSRALEKKYKPIEQSDAAREGEDAHRYACALLKSHFSNSALAVKGTVTDEMKDGATLFVDHVTKFYDPTFKVYIEKSLDISVIHPDCYGTPDCWMISDSRKELHVWEYKFGHTYVDVFENWQLIEYAAGILDLLKITGLEDRTLRVYFHIVQPRCYHRDGHIRTWSIKADMLRGYFNKLEHAENAAAQDHAPATPSPECTHCLGRHACIALQQTVLSMTYVTEMNSPFDLTPRETGGELRYLKKAAKLLEARITGLEGQAVAMLARGDNVPHFKLDQGYARDRWTKDPEEIIALGQLFGVDLARPPEVITPNQAIKLGVPATVAASYYEKPKGALKLVEDDGKQARKVFGGKK